MNQDNWERDRDGKILLPGSTGEDDFPRYWMLLLFIAVVTLILWGLEIF